MAHRRLNLAVTAVVFLTAILISNELGVIHGQTGKVPGEGFAAVPGQKGGQDVFGPYDPVQNWQKPLAEGLPELKGWTYSQATYVFPETPDRIFIAQKGLLPELPERISRLSARADNRRHLCDLMREDVRQKCGYSVLLG